MTVLALGDNPESNVWATMAIRVLDIIERAVFAPGREPYYRLLGVLIAALVGLGIFLGMR